MLVYNPVSTVYSGRGSSCIGGRIFLVDIQVNRKNRDVSSDKTSRFLSLSQNGVKSTAACNYITAVNDSVKAVIV